MCLESQESLVCLWCTAWIQLERVASFRCWAAAWLEIVLISIDVNCSELVIAVIIVDCPLRLVCQFERCVFCAPLDDEEEVQAMWMSWIGRRDFICCHLCRVSRGEQCL